MGETKVCRRCGEAKALGEFHRTNKAPDGRRQPCAACRMAENAARRPPVPTTKVCKRCQGEFPLAEFHRDWKASQRITVAYCRRCFNTTANEKRAERRAADPLRFTCRQCGQERQPGDLMPSKNGGRLRLCRDCHRRISRETNAKKRASLPTTKVCRDCGEEKPRAAFPLFGGKPATRCKPCFRVWENARRHAEREKAPRRNRFYRAYIDENSGILVKKCTSCKVVKPVQAGFGQRERKRQPKTTRRSGDPTIRSTCIECDRVSALVRLHADPKKVRKIAKVRAERIRNAPRVETINRMAIIERDNQTCYLCGDVLSPGTRYPDPKSIVLDHVVPLTRGGSHTADNLRVACSRCNNRKKQKLLGELSWYQPRDQMGA